MCTSSVRFFLVLVKRTQIDLLMYFIKKAMNKTK